MADVEETKFCSNCKKDISSNNFVMHEAHCFRHIVLCKHCEEPIPKAEIEQHFQDQHEKIPCEKCGQRVEKMYLEQHETDHCPKKPQQCLYCDLECPKSDLKAHLDYCGSRTEQCPKCSQFVLFRDQLRHEESDCTYPSPKPPSHNNSSNDLFGYFDETPVRSDFPYGYSPGRFEDSTQEHLNPFVFDEMNRFLNNRSEAPRRSPLVEDMSQFVPLGQSSSSAFQPVHRRNEFSQPKQNNYDTWQSRRDSDQQHRNTDSSSNPADGDIDYLLALHLAQDLNSSETHRDTVNTFEGEDAWEQLPSMTAQLSEILPHVPISAIRDTGVEDTEIPCEFCGEPFPTEVLVHHQSGCEIRREDDDMRGENRPSDINSSRTLASIPPMQIPIVNNLSYTGQQQMEYESSRSSPDPVDHEETMLPCEFCRALLPLDYLVQHQAVCEAEGNVRGDSPDLALQVQQHKVKNNNVTRKEKVSNIVQAPEFPSARSLRHQGDPEISLDFSSVLRQSSEKTVNLNNSSSRNRSNGASHLTSRSKVKEKPHLQSLVSDPKRRQIPAQTANSVSLESSLRSQNRRSKHPLGNGIHDISSDEEVERCTGVGRGAYINQTSRKALKQRDNQERQTGTQRVGPAASRIARSTHLKDSRADGAASALTFQSIGRGLPPATSSLSVRQSGTTSSRHPVNNAARQPGSSSSSTHPRRSGNQVFAGPAKKTAKRRLPDPPS